MRRSMLTVSTLALGKGIVVSWNGWQINLWFRIPAKQKVLEERFLLTLSPSLYLSLSLSLSQSAAVVLHALLLEGSKVI